MFTKWKIRDFGYKEGPSQTLKLLEYDDRDWDEISVPGDVHDYLINNGRISDPFYDQNEWDCQWVSEREWWYRLRFDKPMQVDSNEELALIFNGIDTFATIWFNGNEIGKTDNMFRKYEFDVTKHYNYSGVNIITVCIDPVLEHQNKNLPFQSWGRNVERVSLRKAQYQFGWDWGPRLLTVGLWQPVAMEKRNKTHLTDIHFYTLDISRDKSCAMTAVDVKLSEGPVTKTRAIVQLKDNGGIVVAHKDIVFRTGETSQKVYMQIDNPELWWIHELGNPALYTLTVSLAKDDVIIDSLVKSVGIRTIHLDQSPDTDEPGTRFFRFILNSVPIFAKGANWIPADSLIGRLQPDDYERLLDKAIFGNINMLRIWGGGIYENDCFYDYCDQKGILVWQDFMFACAMYPERPIEFVDTVKEEATYQVNRLKNYPCMALWCGNNENQWIHDKEHWDELNNYLPGNLYYHKILSDIVKEHDGQLPYWPGSPYAGNDHNGMNDGDRHNWHVWHGDISRNFGEQPERDFSSKGVAFTNYAIDMGRFISEFGMHASPVLETLRRSIPEDQLYFHSPSMDHHNKDDPKNKGDNLMMPVTGLPDNLEDYIKFSMITQAEGLKFALEHFRSRKPHCSGALIWQFNDCWPSLSWSVVDYFSYEKAGYYYMKRAFKDVIAVFKTNNNSVDVFIVNDRIQDFNDKVIVKHISLDGNIKWTREIVVNIGANKAQKIYQIDHTDLYADADHCIMVTSTEAEFESNHYFFVPIKELNLKKNAYSVKIEKQDSTQTTIKLSALSYVLFLNIEPVEGIHNISDNYFDLWPGEKKNILIYHDSEFDLKKINIKSW